MRRIIPMAVLAPAALLIACGSKSESGDSAQTAATVAAYTGTPGSNAGSGPACVTAADVKEALGFEVRELTKGMKHYGPMWSCGFAAADDQSLPGVTIQFAIEPATEADKRFDDMRNAVTMARGTPTKPDPVAVGERGMSYRTSSSTMAAAVKGGQLYTVEVRYGAVSTSKFGDKQEGTVTLLRKLVGT